MFWQGILVALVTGAIWCGVGVAYSRAAEKKEGFHLFLLLSALCFLLTSWGAERARSGSAPGASDGCRTDDSCRAPEPVRISRALRSDASRQPRRQLGDCAVGHALPVCGRNPAVRGSRDALAARRHGDSARQPRAARLALRHRARGRAGAPGSFCCSRFSPFCCSARSRR